jgi:enamine deaminase RidA (YjgF/YER057c/UK114 family)
MATVATVLEVKQRYYDLTAQSRAKDNKDGSLIPKMEALQDDIENIPDYQDFTDPNLVNFLKDLDAYIDLIKVNTTTVRPLPKIASVQVTSAGVIETNSPSPPVSSPNDAPTTGNPTQPQLTSGNISGTGIATSDANRSHACDTTLFVQRNISLAKIFEPTIRAIREVIKAIMDALGISPGSNGLIEQIKKIKRYVDDITKFLKKIQNALDALVTVVKKINALINYILSLPARLLALFVNCLKELYAELKAQFTDVVKSALGDKNDGESVIKEAQSLLKSTQTLVATAASTATQITSLPASTTSAIMNPSGTTLTDAQATALAKDLYSTFDNTKTYEMA